MILDFHDNCVFQPNFLGLKFVSFEVFKACQLHFFATWWNIDVLIANISIFK
jgi:hypothetical protein